MRSQVVEDGVPRFKFYVSISSRKEGIVVENLLSMEVCLPFPSPTRILLWTVTGRHAQRTSRLTPTPTPFQPLLLLAHRRT